MTNHTIDLRSDTVTRPGPAMYRAMAAAELGDDVYGDDPTVTALEAKGAALLGFESALFMASGTQSNLVALLTHCRRGEEIITGARYHVYRYEAGGGAVLGGIPATVLPVDGCGRLDPDAVRAAIKGDDPHFPITRLLSLENPTDGRAQPRAHIEALLAVAREGGLATHLDGARLMNAAQALGCSAADLAAGFDSVSLCLSKGLGAPMGTLLLGGADFIRRARRNRKMVGGGLRQAGLVAACGLVALQENIARLDTDHANAARLARALADLPGLAVDTGAVETNMVFLGTDTGADSSGDGNGDASAKTGDKAPDLAALRRFLHERQILVGSPEPRIRLVTHLDISTADIDRVITATRDFCAGHA